MEDMWEVDLGTAPPTNLWAFAYIYEMPVKLSWLCILFVTYKRLLFCIQYLLGKHTVGNKTHKLVTEVVPNHKVKLYQKIFHTVIWILSDWQKNKPNILNKPKTIIRTKMPAINWINAKGMTS